MMGSVFLIGSLLLNVTNQPQVEQFTVQRSEAASYIPVAFIVRDDNTIGTTLSIGTNYPQCNNIIYGLEDDSNKSPPGYYSMYPMAIQLTKSIEPYIQNGQNVCIAYQGAPGQTTAAQMTIDMLVYILPQNTSGES